jgi:hypothetical protein
LQLPEIENLINITLPVIDTKILGRTALNNLGFENPDGSALTINKDYWGNLRKPENNLAGPFIKKSILNAPQSIWEITKIKNCR